MEKLAFSPENQNMRTDDLSFMQDTLDKAITDRTRERVGDVAGLVSGGFVEGGVASLNSNPQKINVAAGIGYTATGERFDFGGATAVVVDVTGATQYVVISYTTTPGTPTTDPITQVPFNSRIIEAANVVVLNSFTPGDVNGQGVPYVPVATTVYTGGVGPMVITDLRTMVNNLPPNSVGTIQLQDEAVTYAKLAKNVRPVFWTEDPGIYYDKDTASLKAKNPSAVFLPLDTSSTGKYLAGFPVSVPSGFRVVYATFTSGPSATVQVANSFTSIASLSAYVLLGTITQKPESFRPIQAPVDSGEGVLGAEEVATSTNLTPYENMRRRTNEGFQSFTAQSNDGNAAGAGSFNEPHITGSDFYVRAGISYVAGARFYLAADTKLDATNTNNFPGSPGNNSYDLYILRNLASSQYRFDMEGSGNPAPANSYWLGTLTYTASVPSAVVDERVFSPIPEAAIARSTARTVKIGAGLKNVIDAVKSAYQITVLPGTVGFPDGETRTNLVSKTLDFATAFNPAILLQDELVGQLQTYQSPGPLGLEPLSHYAIFATADHRGTSFNLVAAKVPFFKGAVGSNPGGGQYRYQLPAGVFPPAVYPGQRIRASIYDCTGPQPSISSGVPFSAVTADSDTPETVATVVGNIVTTNLNGGTPLATGPNMTFGVMNNLQPDPALTGVTKYRLLGIVSTDGNSTSPILRWFDSSDTDVSFVAKGTTSSLWPTTSSFTGTVGHETIVDTSMWAPLVATRVKFQGYADCMFPNGAFDEFAEFYVGPGSSGAGSFYASVVWDPGQQWAGSTFGWKNQASSVWRGETATSMGLVKVSSYLSGGNVSLRWSEFYVLGYSFDVKKEWGRQTWNAATATGGFVS